MFFRTKSNQEILVVPMQIHTAWDAYGNIMEIRNFSPAKTCNLKLVFDRDDEKDFFEFNYMDFLYLTTLKKLSLSLRKVENGFDFCLMIDDDGEAVLATMKTDDKEPLKKLSSQIKSLYELRLAVKNILTTDDLSKRAEIILQDFFEIIKKVTKTNESVTNSVSDIGKLLDSEIAHLTSVKEESRPRKKRK